jgi:hypothetical protein
MTENPTQVAAFASQARHVLACLKRHGGSVRIGPLVRHCGLDLDALAAAVNELAERRWVKISFRKPRKVMPPDLPERCRAVDRVTTTRYGRWRYSVTWPSR